MRKFLSRAVKFVTASSMAVLFGFPGVALANQASISNTGPDSYNKIKYSNSQRCEVRNDNNIHAVNNVSQNAESGDAVVGGSGWNKYDPAAWAAQGRSFNEWQLAVSAYMKHNQNNWQNNWNDWGHGGGNTTGGDATSGNASNVSNNHVSVDIDNGNACSNQEGEYNHGNNGHNTHTNNENNSFSTLEKTNGNVQASNNERTGRGSYGTGSQDEFWNSLTGSSNYGGRGGSSYYNPNTGNGSAGGKGGGNYNSPSQGGSSGNGSSISNTGPDSYNKISNSRSSSIQVSNNNNVNLSNSVWQNAESGNANVSGNTTGGNATTGDARNVSTSTFSFNLNN